MEVLTILSIICASSFLCSIFAIPKFKKLTSNFLASSGIYSIFCELRSGFAYCLCFVLYLPFFLIPIVIYKSLVILIARVKQPDFGNILSALSTIFQEDCIFREGIFPPKATIVNSVTLEAPIGLDELRRLFDKNVIKREHNNDPRYPELQQYLVKFMGHTFWKRDDQFMLEDHIIELDMEQNLSLIHQEMTNKPFTPQKSPWELVLINGEEKTVLVGRFHHCIADAKSIIKLFVECLGNQDLTMPQPQQIHFGVVDRLLMCWHLIPIAAGQLSLLMSCWNHPWKVDRTKREVNYSLPQLIRFSAKLSMADIKKVGRASGGTASSVIMAVISRSISKVKPDLGDILSMYVLPQEKHPPTLGNHADLALVVLPTSNTTFTTKRLESCHKIFKKLKALNIGRYWRAACYQIGTIFDPLRKIIVRELSLSSFPIGITNIAGESKGFSIGGRGCTEFAFSVGTMYGDAGVIFCASSYKDHLQIAVISKDGILAESELEKLADGISEELEKLKKITYV